VDSDVASLKTDCDYLRGDLNWFFETIKNTDNNTLVHIREQLEATAIGQKCVAESRRLYAVLRPTRAENARRIENIVNLASHSEMLTMIHNVRASTCS